MDFKTMPQAGDPIEIWCSGREDGIATVLEVRPYTGAYPQWFTHIMRFTAERTRAGWMEVTINVQEARDKN